MKKTLMKRIGLSIMGGLIFGGLLMAAVFAQDTPRRDGGRRPPPDNNQGQGQGGGYSLEQAISDRAQRDTIAFDGLAFLTSDNMGCLTFIPPGKVSDYFGFQYMRDIDANELGHNTSFVPRIANNMLYVLTDTQRAQLIALAKAQVKQIKELGYKRFPLVNAFWRLRQGDIPKGAKGLDKDAVMKYSGEMWELDGLLAYQRAQVCGGIIRALDDKQKAYLAKLSFKDSHTWPEIKDQVDKRSMSHEEHVAVMTYASEMFSWYAGSVEADVYFCPERHGTYFGSFYMKDMPIMGKQNAGISTALTGDSGEEFLNTLTEAQRRLITELVEIQRKDLNEIVSIRRTISTELRKLMRDNSVKSETILKLSNKYGQLDGEISYYYATRFSEVAKTVTAEQKAKLVKLRNLNGYECKGAYLYSAPIAMPTIENTDFLFGVGSAPTKSIVTTSKESSKAPPASSAPTVSSATAKSGFTLSSPEIGADGLLPKDYTGDGSNATLSLEWSNAPAATKNFALIMHHIDREGQTKWYWILYNIPAGVQSLAKNSKGVGTLGNNSINDKTEYAPPHSKGPGAKTYILTLYALSGPVKFSEPAPQGGINREVLLTAMKGLILGSSELKVTYTRSGDDSEQGRDQPPPPPPDEQQ